MQLGEIAPWGRTLMEYRLMFDLSDENRVKRILGCGDGPASFNAEMTALGYSVVSVDPIYQFSEVQIRQRIEANYNTIITQLKQNSERYIWKNFRDADELGQKRLAAMEQFLLDYSKGKSDGRYRFQSLPHLDLDDGEFELGLCSHLLFLYTEHLSLDFHIASVLELLRVCQEVRIFPLVQLNGTASPYLEPVVEHLTHQGFDVRVQSVNYEFQRGGNQMLLIKS